MNEEDVIPHSVDEDEACKIANIAVQTRITDVDSAIEQAYLILNKSRLFTARKRQERYQKIVQLNEASMQNTKNPT